MSIFSKDLPLTISLANERIQGQFISLSKSHIAIRVPHDLEKLTEGAVVLVSFMADKFDLRFDSEVVQKKEDVVIITKPKEIKKKKHREATRLEMNIPITFTLWEKQDQYEGEIINISASGCKLISPVHLKPQQIITMNGYISEGQHKIRLLCQAMSIWCRVETQDNKYTCGITFTTLSYESQEKIEAFVTHMIEKPVPDEYLDVDNLV